MMTLRQLGFCWALVSVAVAFFIILDRPSQIHTTRFWTGVLYWLGFSAAIFFASEGWGRCFLPSIQGHPRRK